MLCKMTSKNQITLPKEMLKKWPGQIYFDASIEENRIILVPVSVRPIESPELGAIRNKVSALGLDEDSVADIVAEARNAYGS
jgi:bifunctional DNA-binding transcriptional regulator/antitoxin component of YhaV-PrlF toxin-antitoxin module